MSKRPNTTSVKISNEIKKFVDSSNKTISYGDLLEIGYNTIIKKNKKKQLYEYKKKLKKLKQKKAFIEIEIDELEEVIEELESNNDPYDEFDSLTESTLKMIKAAIEIYIKKDQETSISEFLENNKEMVYLHSNKTNNSEKDYKKLVVGYYNKHYD